MPARCRLPALVALALLVPALAWAQASLYRWVDKDGKVHYSDTPPTEPVRSVTQKRISGGAAADPQLPYATRVAMQRSPVALYVSPTCGEFCSQGRGLLARRGIPYTELDVSHPAEAEAVKKLIGTLSVPVFTLGDKVMKGYNEGAWQAALDAAGYPRTALPGQINPRPPEPAKPASPPAAASPPATTEPAAAEPATAEPTSPGQPEPAR